MDLETFKKIPKNKIIHIVAKWCMPCKINQILLIHYKDHVVEIDYDDNIELMKNEHITKVPTVLWKTHKIEGISTWKLKQLLKSFDQQ